MKLSIIMPCFNVEKTLERALASILRQRVDFEYEVLIVNDGSSDATREIAENYCMKHPCFRLINNLQNLGNAQTFKAGLEAARGDYFTVLDGDDFYTVRDKLQKQVDFLDSDKDGAYAAVAHKFLSVYPDGSIKQDTRLFAPYPEYSFMEFIQLKFYFHTSSIMYRNYFRGLEIPILKTQRGDTIRTLIAMNAAYGKLRVLDFVGSAYFINPEGIWSSLDDAGRRKINLAALNSCLKYVESRREKKIIETSMRHLAGMPMPPEEHLWTSYMLLKIVRDGIAAPHAFHDSDFISRKLYKSELADSICESVGYIQYVLLGFSPGKAPDQKKAAILISALNRTGGGIYREIIEMCEVMRTREIHLIVTDMRDREIAPEVRQELAKFSNVKLILMGDYADKLAVLELYLHKLNAGRIYYYCGHDNTLVDAALQDYGAKNIVPFVFDHGLSLGLDNGNIDLIIAKTPKDYRLLAKKFADRVIYIPCWSKGNKHEAAYTPFASGLLVTATAAARFYKYEGGILGKFPDLIASILKVTGGKHIHYGPLPREVIGKIKETLRKNGMEYDKFLHVEWADNLAGSMLENHVDLFVSPFPVGSIKLNLQCEAAGIPMLVYDGGVTRIEMNDFLHPEVLQWKTRAEFFGIISSITKEKLSKLSDMGKEWFLAHNDLGRLMPYIMFDKCFETVPIPPAHVDMDIIDIRNIHDMLSWN